MKSLAGLLLKTLFIAAAVCFVLTFVISVHVVHSNNMYPAVRDGDLVISYRLQEILYGDVIVYRRGDRYLTGRIAGLPGDRIDMDREGRYTVNGTAPLEMIFYETRAGEGTDIRYPYTVEENAYFVLNDMREDTGDSRQFGAIAAEDTCGSLALLLRRRGW